MEKNAIRDKLAGILKQPDDQLRRNARYAVQPTEDGLAWETVTEMCCLGGCDMCVYTFPTERDALLLSALLEAVGYRPSHNIACSSCYAEYRKDFIGK